MINNISVAIRRMALFNAEIWIEELELSALAKKTKIRMENKIYTKKTSRYLYFFLSFILSQSHSTDWY